MSTRLGGRRQRRQLSTFLVLLVASMIMMAASRTGPARDTQAAVSFAFQPFERALNGVADGAGSVARAFADVEALRGENDRLTQENEALRARLAQLPAIQHLNDELSQVTQTRSAIRYHTVTAQVLVRDISEMSRSVVIDRGTDDGLHLGDVVVAAGVALVGRVIQAGPNSAEVLLINDASSTVIGQEESTGATGEVVGQAGGVLAMQNVDATANLQLHQVVVTAGLSLPPAIRSPFPRGLVIGQVVDVSRDPNAVVQTAFLAPAVDLDRLDFVLVITDYQGGLPLPGESVGPSTSTSPSPTPSHRPSVRPSASRRPAATPTKY